MRPCIEGGGPSLKFPSDAAANTVIHAKIPPGSSGPLVDDPAGTISGGMPVRNAGVVIVTTRWLRPEFDGERAACGWIQLRQIGNRGAVVSQVFGRVIPECGHRTRLVQQ